MDLVDLRKARKGLGLTAGEMGEALGMSAPHIRDIEVRDRPITPSKIVLVADAYFVDPSRLRIELFERSGKLILFNEEPDSPRGRLLRAIAGAWDELHHKQATQLAELLESMR